MTRSPLQDAVDQRIDDDYLAASAAACDDVAWRSAQALLRCGLAELRGGTLDQVALHLGVVPAGRHALTWLLAAAAALDAVRIEPSPQGPRYLPGPLPDGAAGGAVAAAVERCRERIGSSLPLFTHVGDCYPDYLQGRRSGHLALFKGAALQLWEGYFSAANPLHDIHNQLAWTGVEQALDRLRRRGRVLELGVGTGGGTAALLRGLAEPAAAAPRLATLTLTDLSPSFAMATARRLAPHLPAGADLRHQRLDFSQDLTAQGVEPGSVDVLVGVNAVHNGGELVATLNALRAALAPDGWLVISESLCGPGERVHQEFILNLLPLPRRQPERPDGVPASRFFTAEDWWRALHEAGWRAELAVNRRGPQLALLALAQP